MKLLLSLILGILAFVGVFWLDSLLINYLVNLIPKDWQEICEVLLWILAFLWTTTIAIILGILVGSIMYSIFDNINLTKRKKKYFKQQFKYR